MEGGTPCASCNLRKDSPAPAVLARRGMGAGSACRASPLLCAPQRRGGFFWGVIRFVWAVTGVRTAPPVRAEVYAGSTRPHPRRAGILWEVIHSIGWWFLWKAVRLVQAVTCVRTAPRPPYWRGAAWVQGGPARVYAAPQRRGGFFWEVIRFVWAVTGVRTAPRPPYWRGAEEHAGSACGAEVYAGSTRPHKEVSYEKRNRLFPA